MKYPLLVLSFLTLATASRAADDKPATIVITGSGNQVSGAGITTGAADKAGASSAASAPSSGGGGAAAPAAQAAPAAPPLKPSKSFPKAKVLVSNSPAGPFVVDGAVCDFGQVYTRTTGLDRTKPPKGCASPFDNKDCQIYANHRDFTAGEWLDPFTLQTVVNAGDYPLGKYAFYLSLSKTDIKLVGVATLKSCPHPAASCRWTSPDAVIGPCGGPGCSNTPCTQANRGATGAGGGGMWTCTCN